MHFRMLGPVEVADGERRLGFGSAHQRTILAVLLAARGEVVSTDRLMDALWEDRPPPTARKALQSHLSRLRRALGGAGSDAATPILTHADGYRLEPDGHHLDAIDFEVAVDRAAQATDPGDACRLLDEALAMWRGPAFGELATHPHLRAEAVRLEELRHAARSERIDALLSLGEERAVIGELEAMIVADPLTEHPYGQLMVALYRTGRQADALAVYRRLRATLRTELGVEPTPELQRLHQRVLAQDDGLLARTGHRHASTASGLLGREQDVAALAAALVPGTLLTLTGPGGVGKTRLAEAGVAASTSGFDDVVWCDLGGLREPAGIAATLLEAMGIPQPGDEPPQERVIAALGSRSVLLVLDCCEHLRDAVASLVARLRDTCPNLTILTTSREHLHLPGERVVDVAPLPVPPQAAGAAEVLASPAGALFCRRAAEVETSFALEEADAALVAQLCARLDGIPLALELAAARVRALSLEALVARIDRRFDVLTGGSPAQTDRHRTLHGMVDWSYQLLTEAEARVFDRLAVFAGSFTLAAAEEVGAQDETPPHEVAGLLAELVDKSLVVVERGGREVRYRLLDTLRAYGSDRLRERGELTAGRRAHATYHVELAAALGGSVTGPDDQVALQQLAASFDDLRVAAEALLAQGAVAPAAQLAAALHDELVFRPRDEVFDWAERALALPDAEQVDAATGVLATVARGAMNRGQLDRAHDLADRAMRRGDRTVATLWAQYVLTTLALYEGRLGDAVALAEERVSLATDLAHAYHRALALASRSLAEGYRGDRDAADAAARQAREAAEASGSRTARAWSLYCHGEARLEAAPDEATTLLEEAIAEARHVDRRFIEGVALVSLASLTGRRGDPEQAIGLFRRTIAHWRSLGAYTQQLTTLRNLVDLLVRVGADEPAAVLHGAVRAAATPSFGAEAARLAAAWDELERRLGPQARSAAQRGAMLTEQQVVTVALDHLDDLLTAASVDG